MKYRPEIDGLRACAIIPVILFHAGFDFCKGGFLGVDVFFVISGYLITGILIKEREKGIFSLNKFYVRRIRRIVPGLFFMLTLASTFYLLFASPSIQESELLGDAIISSVAFSSNLYFAYSSGYFASNSELLPFLHTWSLAVEEQFYIIYPFLFLLLFKPGKRTFIFFLLVILILSLGLAQFGSSLLGRWNFYLLPTRAWELGAGAMSFFISRNINKKFHSKFICELLSVLGLSSVFLSFLVLDQSIQAPGVWCLLPVVGTILIILFCRQGSLSYFLLSRKYMVYLGLISYGAYLWHHPILSICRHFVLHPSHLPNTVTFIVVVTSLLLACLSYHFIEKPFRNRKLSVKWLLLPLGFLVAIGLFPKEISRLGFNARSAEFSEAVRDLARTNYDSDRREDGYYFGNVGKEKNDIVLLGDSHARMLIPVLARHLKLKGLKGFHPYSKRIRSNFLAINQTTDSAFLSLWLEEVKHYSLYSKAIVISFRHSRSDDNSFYNPIYPVAPRVFFENLLERLNQLSNFVPRIIVIGPFPESPYWGPNLGRNYLQSNRSFDNSLSSFEDLQRDLLNFLSMISNENSKIDVIYPHLFLSENNSSLVNRVIDGNSNQFLPFYYDDDHVNGFGSEPIIGKLMELLE
jgi:peptidoglycan/LPS O-acetylase OafA/YrhL